MKISHRYSMTICCALTVVVSNSWAQEAPAPETVPAQTDVTAKIATTETSWREDARLNAQISLQAKRMPLAEFLTAVSAKSGITLDGGELARTKRVTLSVNEMPVRDAMISLEDLYQADWQVHGDGYALKTRAMLPWQRNLAQLGNLHNWGFYRTNWSRPFAPPYITTEYSYDRQELLDSLDRKELLSPQGIAFSSLPPETQQEVRHSTSWEIIKQAVWDAYRANAIEGNWQLRLRPANYPAPDQIEFFDAPIPDNPDPSIGELISDESMLLIFAVEPQQRPSAYTAAQRNPPPKPDAAR